MIGVGVGVQVCSKGLRGVRDKGRGEGSGKGKQARGWCGVEGGG